jgi:uridine phosphorylase
VSFGPDPSFVPHHLTASAEQIDGNDGIGRYVLLPGSDGRAEKISELLHDRTVVPSPRRHTVYTGWIEAEGTGAGRLDLAVVATGMGCPSVDIIVHELIMLGARRFLRVGTSGSMQPRRIRAGDLVVATAAVRDEHTSRCWVPAEFPAVASPDMVRAARHAVARLGLEARTHLGIVHSKDSLVARELGEGPLGEEGRRYMEVLRAAGVAASEMEAAHLFIRTSLLDHELSAAGEGPRYRAHAGAILAVIGDDQAFADASIARRAETAAIELGLETLRQLALIDGDEAVR